MGKRRNNDLTTLGRELQHCRARAARLWRSYHAINEKLDPEGSTLAHRAWSEAVDEALRIADAISRKQAATLAELLIQFDAIWWWLIEDDSILDASAKHWLKLFRRSLRGLTAKTNTAASSPRVVGQPALGDGPLAGPNLNLRGQ